MQFRQFLETVPPLETRVVSAVALHDNHGNISIGLPAIYLFCSHPECQGVRFYDPTEKELTVYHVKNQGFSNNEFATFRCRNCRRFVKTYALFVAGNTSDLLKINMMKYGEHPRFGEPRQNVVENVLDDEIKFFDRGYRAETAGLGIGAFAYYRRFVESHKDKIFAEIRKVAVAQNLGQALLDTIDRAMGRREFSAAVGEMKDAIPDSLRIAGQNPLTLLHSAISAELHAGDDDVICLEIAQDIRTVLSGLAEKTSQALKSTAELNEAVKRLGQRASGQISKAKKPQGG
jgi:hypothetical protein